MDLEVKERLDRLENLEKENNKILRSLRAQARWATFWGIVKTVVFVVPLFVAYYYLQPYLDVMLKTYQKLEAQSGVLEKVQGQLPDIGSLLNKVTGSSSQ